MADAFYVPDGERFVPTELTRGPWDPDAQHGGPPAALAGREIERLDAADEWFVGRITCEILRPVPLEPLTVSAEVIRPGRTVQLVDVVLSDGAGEVVRVRAWRLRGQPVALEPPPPPAPPPPGPDTGAEHPFLPSAEDVGYHLAVEQRFVSGSFRDPGPATVWIRMRHPLIAGESPSPLTRVLVAADSGNGVSAALDQRRYLFVNTDLTVHLHREPVGEWVCLDAITFPEPDGVGMSDTALFDERGRIGRAVQTLVVRAR